MDPIHTLLARASDTGSAPACSTGNEYDGHMGLRISSIFVIMVASSFGAIFPVLAHNTKSLGIPTWAFFIAKYFGSGVIIATAFIHLLSPAEDALRNPCLTGPITEYSWVEGIILMTIVLLFFVELMVMRFARFGQSHSHSDDLEADHQHANDPIPMPRAEEDSKGHIPGEDHLGHSREHHDTGSSQKSAELEDYMAQLASIFILEFGIIFHSIFIGLTLSVSGSEFTTLYIVLVFHQGFEGLGLGSRLATLPWPPSKRYTPFILAGAYGISTPVATAIGLGVRKSYPPDGRTTLIVNGIFDSISAGILIYTALVELMAHEFMFSTSMQKAPIQVVLSAFLLLCMGAGLMALLGKWV